MKKAFTLIEVNLAIMIMAFGILGIISLYSFGFREERQSREDVASAAYADAVMGPLVTALTATNVTWENFNAIKSYPESFGWGSYMDRNTGKIVPKDRIRTIAETAYSRTIGALKLGEGFPSQIQVSDSQTGKLTPALVVMHDADSAVVRISFRAVDRERTDTLMSAPLYYTEARFQGVMGE